MLSLASRCLHRASLAFVLLPFVEASVYITYPYRGITCSAGSECTVTWADDGLTPLLAAVGRSDFALYHGTNTLVQQMASGLDVSQTRELTFVPNSNAGPNSDAYWIKLTSLSARDPNDTSQPYASFSGYFSLDGMSGNAASPVPSLTSPLPSSSPGPSSITNGVVSTTTLSKASSSESGAALSSELSALSAISSAATGISSSRALSTTTSLSAAGASGSVSTSTPSGTNAGSSASSSAGGSSQSFGPDSLLARSFQLGIALVLIALTTTCVFSNARFFMASLYFLS